MGNFLIALVLLPLFLIAAVGMALIMSIRYGGPFPHYAAMNIMIYYYDRYCNGQIIQSWKVNKWINEFLNTSTYFEKHFAEEQRTWIWTRMLNRYSDPITGPLSAVFLSMEISVIFWLFGRLDIDLQKLQFSQTLVFLNQFVAEKSTTQWILLFLMVGFATICQNELMNRAVLKRTSKSYLRGIDFLENEKKGKIQLVEQSHYYSHIKPDQTQAYTFKKLINQYFREQYEFRDQKKRESLDKYMQLSDTKPYETFYFEFPDQQVPNSFCVFNPLGKTILFLNRKLDDTAYSKFVFLHEVGHTRLIGRRSVLASEVGPILFVLTVWLTLAGLVASKNAPVEFYYYLKTITYIYSAWIVIKWYMWLKEGQKEISADLFAFSGLSQSQISEAMRLKLLLLNDKLKSMPLFMISSYLNLAIHIFTLRFYSVINKNDPRKWERAYRRKFTLLDIPAIVFSLSCGLLIFTCNIHYPFVISAWLLAIFLRLGNTGIYSDIEKNKMKFETLFLTRQPNIQ